MNSAQILKLLTQYLQTKMWWNSSFQPTRVQLTAQLERKMDDFLENECCSCHQLHQQRKAVTVVKDSDNLGSEVWPS